MFRCSRKFSEPTTQKVVFHLLSNRVSRKILVNGKQPLLYCQIFKNHNGNPFETSSGLSIRAFFRICWVFLHVLLMFGSPIHIIFTIWWPYCLDFDKFRNTSPLQLKQLDLFRLELLFRKTKEKIQNKSDARPSVFVACFTISSLLEPFRSRFGEF